MAERRSGSPAPGSPRSRSSTRRCSTPSACTSPTRCAPSSSWTPTRAWSGLGETYADVVHLAASGSRRRRDHRPGCVRAQRYSRGDLRSARRRQHAATDPALAGMITSASVVDRVFSPFEVACLDVQGHATGRPVSDLLGGKVRDAVPFSAYLFYKWAAHPGGEPDSWGEALDPAGIVAQARRMIDEYGFTAIKLKGGVFPPEEEMAAIEALHAAFPGPSAAAGPQRRVDPADLGQGRVRTGGHPRVPRGPDPGHRGDGRGGPAGADAAGHQHVRRRIRPPGPGRRRQRGEGGALRPSLLGRTAALPAAGRHLRHLRSRACRCTPTRTWASAWRRWCTSPARRRTSPTPATRTGRGRPRRSSSPVCSRSATVRWPYRRPPGWVSRSTTIALAALHEQYLRCGVRDRDDTGYMKSIDPDYEAISPRW